MAISGCKKMLMSDKLRYIVNSLQGTSTLQCVIGVVITECVIEH